MRRALILIALLLTNGTASAEEAVVAGISRDAISITANFDGSDLLIYGAVKREAPAPEGDLDVIVTVEGPTETVLVRRKSREAAIWINTAAVRIDRAPSFYAVATTGPMDAILTAAADRRHRISVPLAIRAYGDIWVTDLPDFIDALIRIREDEGRYSLKEGTVSLTEDTLFRTDIDLPANLVEGDYKVRMFLTRDGEVVAMAERALDVRKVGLERWLFTLSQHQPVIYGALSLILAVAAGWVASAAFRLRG